MTTTDGLLIRNTQCYQNLKSIFISKTVAYFTTRNDLLNSHLRTNMIETQKIPTTSAKFPSPGPVPVVCGLHPVPVPGRQSPQRLPHGSQQGPGPGVPPGLVSPCHRILALWRDRRYLRSHTGHSLQNIMEERKSTGKKIFMKSLLLSPMRVYQWSQKMIYHSLFKVRFLIYIYQQNDIYFEQNILLSICRKNATGLFSLLPAPQHDLRNEDSF